MRYVKEKSKMKKFLIIGFGGAGQRELNIVEHLFPSCSIAVWDTGSRPSILPKHITKINHIEEAVDFNPDGVFIATPTSTHINYAEPLLGKAKFILIDKPLDSSLNRCEIFVRNCRTSSTKVYLNFQRRFLSCWQAVKNSVSNNQDGEFLYGIIQIGSYYPDWRPYKTLSELYVTREDLGGGVLLTECHEFDLIQWILGQDIVRVSAQFQKSTNEKDTESNAQLLLNLDMPYGERTFNVILDYLSPKNVRKMELHFKDAVYIVDELNNSVTKINAGGIRKNINILQNNTYTPHEALLQAIVNREYKNTEEKDIPQLKDGLSVNSIIHAAKISQSRNSWEPVVASICPLEGVPYLDNAIKRLQEIFQERLIAVYGLGSLGYGGYIEGWSDFDLDVLVDTTYDDAKRDYNTGKLIEKEIQQMGFERIDIRVYSHEHLNARKTILTYGQCSRACMLCDTAILLSGRDIRDLILRPSRDDLNKEAIGLLINMLDKQDDWWKALAWDDIAAHFALAARFLYTCDKGLIAGKQKALEYFIEKKLHLFSNNILRWVLWSLSCRLNFHPLLIQDSLHEEAVYNLRMMFAKTIEIMEMEV